MAEIVKGVSDGCLQSCCALLGGETAEMPDIYAADEFDLAGFAVGVVERKKIIDGTHVEAGDVVIALAVERPALQRLRPGAAGAAGQGRLRRQRPPAGAGRRHRRRGDAPPDADLRQARCWRCCGHYRVKHVVKAMAHITGGGLPGNLPRVLPEGLTVRVKRDSWPVAADLQAHRGQGPRRRPRDDARLQHGRGLRHGRRAGLRRLDHEHASAAAANAAGCWARSARATVSCSGRNIRRRRWRCHRQIPIRWALPLAANAA